MVWHQLKMARLLVVDDDPDACDLATTSLGRAGHEVVCAPNGRDALAKIIDQPPDLVILDLLMPEMDGPNLLEVLRSYLRLQSLPVVVWTGLGESPLVDRARYRGVNAILVKGKATVGDLVTAVNQELGRLPT